MIANLRPSCRLSRGAEFCLFNQLKRDYWFNLTSRSGVTGRFKRSLYWMESLSREIVPNGSRLDRRVALQSELPRLLRAAGWSNSEMELMQTRLLFAWGALDYWGCYGESFRLLRRGRAPIIGRGQHKGQIVEIDHAVPVAWAPGLFNHPANLIPLPFSSNRDKSSKLKPHDLEIARRLTAMGRLTELNLATVEQAYANGWKRPSAPKQNSANAPSGIDYAITSSIPVHGIISEPLDPRLLVARIMESCESLDGMIARSHSADEEFARVHSVFSEQASRMMRFARCRMDEAETDVETARRAESDTEVWRNILSDLWLKIEKCTKEALESDSLAINHVRHWRSALERMEEARRDAEEELENASEALDEAEEELSEARNSLSEAESALEEARETTVCTGQDRDGNDINEPIDTEPYERIVEAAEELIEEREEVRDQASQRVDDAEEELQEAQKREYAAGQAVQLAEEARIRASACADSAKSARLCGEELAEDVMRLSNLASCIVRYAEDSLLAARNSLEHTREAERRTAEAAVLLQSGSRTFNEIFTAHRRFQADIETRLHALRCFDRPPSILASLR